MATDLLALSRRQWLALLPLTPLLRAQASKDAGEVDAWTCPMDPDIRLPAAGKCPRCGMTLVLKLPDRTEYPLVLTLPPHAIEPGADLLLTLRALDPQGQPVRHFELVHEKLMHLFLVSQDLSYFAHLHPVPQEDGSFQLSARPPSSGMYRILADYFPAGGAPQLAVNTFYVKGPTRAAKLTAELTPRRSENLSATLRTEPEQLLPGLMTRIIYDLDPGEGLEPYLGAWGHMLVASEDLVDLIHTHPFLTSGPHIQFNVIFPRPGKYKIWAQFQRSAVVNTVACVVAVKEL